MLSRRTSCNTSLALLTEMISISRIFLRLCLSQAQGSLIFFSRQGGGIPTSPFPCIRLCRTPSRSPFLKNKTCIHVLRLNVLITKSSTAGLTFIIMSKKNIIFFYCNEQVDLLNAFYRDKKKKSWIHERNILLA